MINVRLKISINEEHESGQSFLENINARKKFAWPNTFKSLKDARLIKRNYLKGIENLEIISLYLSEEYRTDFLMNEREENDFEVSIYDFLEKSLPFCVEKHR